MGKHKEPPMDSALDEDIIEMLAEAEDSAPLAEGLVARMHESVMQKIKQEQSNLQDGFSIVHTDDKKWIEALPGAYYKVLHDDGNGLDGLLSYLFKLDPGFKMEGHDHPFDEETLMLEGDLTLGDITLHKGDFHFTRAGEKHGNVSTENGCIAFLRGAFPA